MYVFYYIRTGYVEQVVVAFQHVADLGKALATADAEITALEQNIAAMPSVTEMLHAGKTPEDMMEMALKGFNPNVLDTREVRYHCDCSAERTEEMLLSLGRKELEKLRDEDPHCEVVCHFCHTKYEFDLNDLVKKISQ